MSPASTAERPIGHAQGSRPSFSRPNVTKMTAAATNEPAMTVKAALKPAASMTAPIATLHSAPTP